MPKPRLSGWSRFMLIYSVVVIALGIALWFLYARLFSPATGAPSG